METLLETVSLWMRRMPWVRGRGLSALALLVAYPCLAQNQITTVSPNSAVQGASSVVVSFTLDSDTPAPPPAGVAPTSVTIGTISGTSFTHSSQYLVTATFAIPAAEATGTKDAVVTFTTPNGSLTFTSTGGFTVTGSGTSAPTITQQPSSLGVAPGSSVTFTVAASGSGTLSYRWQKDGTTIAGATSTSYAIASVAETDAADYTCVVSNAYGSVTSDAATLVVTDTPAYEGYNLFAPMASTDTYLMDNDGNIVHTWASGYRPGLSVYLLEDGTLMRTTNRNNTTFNSGGSGGGVEQLDWDGNVVWEYGYSSSEHCQHHDIEVLPNGNVLMIAWEYKTETEAIDAGRNPSLLTEGELWPDTIIEVEPSGASGGTIVWEWHVWDHLVQDYDNTRSNYGAVADHPELVDLNYVQNGTADWNHINSVDYNAELDQILVSVHNLGEVWIIDHSTTTAEAASHSGGTSGKGGDLIYRWGNPQVYGAGTSSDQQLFVQHDAEWVATGLPGAGNILVFNNGTGRDAGDYSSIEEITPPVDGNSYTLVEGSAYGPTAPTWSYSSTPTTDFYAERISGAQRLPNGNTLICEGPNGRFFEVTEDKLKVWEYDSGDGVFRVDRYGADYAGFDGTELDDEVTIIGTTYPIVDTGQTDCYNGTTAITAPEAGAAYYGQDAQHTGNQASYTVSGDGLTVLDNVTGLTWTKSPDWDGSGTIDADDKFSYAAALAYVDTLNAANYGGYSDWRVPSTKELYSLIDYRGTDPATDATDTSGLVPFIDDEVFDFAYGDTSAGERVIDSQWAVSTLYVGKVMNNQVAVFGVNFADGRIKGYGIGTTAQGTNKTFYARFCRGNSAYGVNDFTNNGDGTITDSATGLMWMQADSGAEMNWEDALAYAQTKNGESYLGYSDWRLPNAKELQSLVDYTRSPDTTSSAAIDPLFSCTAITDLAGQTNYPWYWSSTTFLRHDGSATFAVYVAFGEGLGSMDGTTVIDVHGAGCQRSDPKDGDAADYPLIGDGPQGDVIRVFNYVRLVRDAPVEEVAQAPTIDTQPLSQTVDEGDEVSFTVVASGSETLSYQWQKDEVDIDGATSATYTIASAAAADEGDYRCVVTNSVGSATSDTATLTVDTSTWSITITVAGGSPGSLVLGVNPDATEGVDDYDAPVPPNPQANVGTAKFVLPGGGEELSKDIRGTLSGSEWWIYVDGTAAGGYTTLSWPGQVFPAENMRMQLLVGSDQSSASVFYGEELDPMGNVAVAKGQTVWIVIDENEPPALGDASFTVSEDSGNGTSVGTVSATDPNDVEKLTYSITGGNNDGVLEIDSTTGEITVAAGAGLDAEGTPSYELTVVVTDNGGLTDSATVTVSILGGNRAPTLADVTFTVDEDCEEGTVVGTLAASDPDAGDVLTHAITAGNGDGTFTIGSTSGTITLSEDAGLNYELKSSYALTVTVTDDGGLSDTATVTILVGDVDEPPVILAATLSVAEDTPIGTYVGVILAADPEGGTMTYSIAAGDPEGAFRIEADPTPKIYVDDSSALDYETTPQYSLTVSAEDVGGNVGTATITVNITDANDAPTLADTNFAVAEDATNGTILGTVVASDQDGDALDYALTAGNDAGVFAIGSTTGAILVGDSSGLDYATTSEYSLTVQVTDSHGATGTGTVTVHVCDGWVVTILAEETAEGVQFGVTSGATDGFDSGLDDETSIVSPQIAIYPQTSDRGGWLRRELKGSTNGSGWEIEVRGGSTGLTLAWDTAALPRTGLQMEETYIPSEYRDSRAVIVATIDMAATTSLHIAPGNSRTMIITPILTEFEIALGEGWSLVSLPIEPDDPAAETVLADADCWYPVWQWEPALNDGAGSYVEATELHALVGYWIYSRCAASVTVVGLAPSDQQTALVAGWNMVGVASDTVLPESSAIATPVSYWDCSNCCYESLYANETLTTGHGYWIYAWNPTTLGGETR